MVRPATATPTTPTTNPQMEQLIATHNQLMQAVLQTQPPTAEPAVSPAVATTTTTSV
jgi:hypothetical protein